MFTIKIKNMKYKNVTILFKNNLNDEDGLDSGTHKVDFNNAVLMVTGSHMVVTEHTEDGNAITGQVFKLDSVLSYKAERE
jgi:hypothetical protein|tara:strand:- start:1635 stop:1874 length:240 start_codon:yes stop_codon:yes gene_type:complete